MAQHQRPLARSTPLVAPAVAPAFAPAPVTVTLDATLHNTGNNLTLAALAGDFLDGLGPLITEALTLSLAGVSPEAGPGLGSNEAALLVMRHAQGGGVDHETLGGLRPGGGRPLPPAVVARLSAVFGHDLSHVRVHNDALAARLAEAAQARAFTVGNEIWFNTGELDLTSPDGLELLLHELTHVIQADQGRAPRPNGDGVTVSSPHDPHEQEAERAAAALLPAVDLYGDGAGLEGEGLMNDAAWSAAVDLGPAHGLGQHTETAISREDLPTSDNPQAREAAGGRLLVMWEGETPLVIRAPESGEAEDIAAAFAEAGATTCEDWEEVSAAEATYPLYYALMLAGEAGEGAIDFEGLGPVAAAAMGETPTVAPSGAASGGAPATGGGMVPQTAGGGMSPGPWAPPGGQPAPFYVGNDAHDGIGKRYREANKPDLVFLNSTPVASIVDKMVPKGDASKLSTENAALRPDILNATKRCVYEIKPANAAAEGAAEASMYVAAFAQAGIVISLGAPAMPGTSGVISGPGGFFQYDSPLPGVIVYRYSKQQPQTVPVPVPQTSTAEEPKGALQPAGSVLSWQYWEEVTGLTGLALVTYLLISEGSRVLYPPRNLVPVP